MKLEDLMVDTKTAWIEFPGCDNFEIEVANLSRKELLALRNQSKKKMKKFDKPKDGEWKTEDKFMYNIYNGLMH